MAVDPAAGLAGLSVTAGLAAALWPRLRPGPLAARLALIQRPPRLGRDPARARPRQGRIGTLASRLHLPGAGAAARLQMAGLRGPGAVTTFLGLRILSGLLLGPATFLYLRLVLKIGWPIPLVALGSLGASLAGYAFPALMLTNRILKRQKGIQRAWPNALDLMLICVESGMGIDQALRKVADEIGMESVDLAEELTLTVSELSYLPDRRQAFENLATRTGLDVVKAVIASLKQAERHGTSLGQSLRVLAQENRDMRLAAAEKKAAALPPKLTVPMILFFLPVLFAVIIAPALMQVFSM